MITFDMLRKQRYDFAGSYAKLRETSQYANYYAPNSWTMYSWEDGDQKKLWDSRWDDGMAWSAFKNRDIENSDWLQDLLEGN
jgi:hypothetical protein